MSGYHDDDVIAEQGDDYMTRDDFNVHKMLVVVTAAGKVNTKMYCRRSVNGSVFYQFYFLFVIFNAIGL